MMAPQQSSAALLEEIQALYREYLSVVREQQTFLSQSLGEQYQGLAEFISRREELLAQIDTLESACQAVGGSDDALQAEHDKQVRDLIREIVRLDEDNQRRVAQERLDAQMEITNRQKIRQANHQYRGYGGVNAEGAFFDQKK